MTEKPQKANHSSDYCLSPPTPHRAHPEHCTLHHTCETTDLEVQKGDCCRSRWERHESELLLLIGFSHTDVGQDLIQQLKRSLQTGPELKLKHISLFSALAQDFMSTPTTPTFLCAFPAIGQAVLGNAKKPRPHWKLRLLSLTVMWKEPPVISVLNYYPRY